MKEYPAKSYLGILIVIALQIFVLFLSDAHAHKVNTYAYREGDKIFGECYFVNGSPCKNSKVEVYDANGNKILETVTDEKGKYSFTTKENKPLRIAIPAGEGHRAEYKLEGIKENKEKPEKKEAKDIVTTKKEIQSVPLQSSINREELREIIDFAIDTKLHGLKAEIIDLRKQMDKISFRDILGGIGYIFGIWGIIMLLKRKKNAS